MVVTRFAPSPTGYLHIGGLRTALFSYLWAKRNGGKFLLRIEDTDTSRNNEDAAIAIVKAFEWIGLQHDGEITYQSQRGDVYAQYIEQLLAEGKAYRCYMSKEELDALRGVTVILREHLPKVWRRSFVSKRRSRALLRSTTASRVASIFVSRTFLTTSSLPAVTALRPTTS